MKNSFQSIQEQSRIESIDILRGFAILGIFLVNMPAFFSPVYYYNPLTYWESTSDRFLNGLVDFLAQASFYPLFAFLFGYGAIILAERMTHKGLSFPVYFSRRLIILLLIGCVHAFLLWHGDILITYAICGFIFILFYKCKGKTLLVTGTLIYVVVFGLFIMGFVGMERYDPSMNLVDLLNSPVDIQTSIQTYSQGSFTDIFERRLQDWMLVNGPANGWVIILNILPLMLIGAGFAKQKWIAQASIHLKLITRLMIIGLVGGVIGKSLPFWEGSLPYTRMMIQDYIGGPLLALFYVMFVVWLVEKKTATKFFQPFAYVGRLSISNYLLQSLVCTTIFYAYGFGLYGQISFTTGFCLVILLYSLQILASRWWIQRFKFGPVEYVWRWGTYGNKPTFKRTKEEGN